jgi:hypothetical protein
MACPSRTAAARPRCTRLCVCTLHHFVPRADNACDLTLESSHPPQLAMPIKGLPPPCFSSTPRFPSSAGKATIVLLYFSPLPLPHGQRSSPAPSSHMQVLKSPRAARLLPEPLDPTFLVGAPSHLYRISEPPPHLCPPSSAQNLAALQCRGPWMRPVSTFPLTGQLPLVLARAMCSAHHCHARAGAARALGVVWASMWTSHALRYGSCRARPCPIVAWPSRPCTLCVWAGRAGLWFRAVVGTLNRNSLSFLSRVIFKFKL